MVSNELKNRVALVTGGSSGIGRATSEEFVRRGAAVVIADVNPEGETLANKINEAGGRASFIKTDVSNSTDVKNLISETLDLYSRLDYAFNNAGVEGLMLSTVDTPEEEWDRVISINLKGVWLCMRAEIEVMLKQGGGRIVNCSSVAGLVGFQGATAYSASKHGVNGLTKAAALEYAKANILINSVCPGVIDTPMISRYLDQHPEGKAAFEAGEPVGRIGTPGEIANAVIWLCSEGATFVTGHALAVDGGWVAQ